MGLRRAIAARLGVDRNGLYKVSKLMAADEALKTRILAVREKHKYYGHCRLALELRVNHKRIQRVVQLYGLQAPRKLKQVKYHASAGSRPAPRNLLLELGIIASYPGHVWACDFTFLWFGGRWYYVATVIDLYTREIVGWSMGTNHDTKLILGALYDGLSRHNTPMYLHFDRGSEYLSGQHLDLCESLEIMVSASDKGSPWQNGHQERFYGTFKQELGPVGSLQSEGELFERIALTLNYYNTKRIHTKLKTNPHQYRQNYNYQYITRLADKTEVRDKVLQISGS